MVIDPKSHLQHNLAALRAAVAPGWEEAVFIPRQFSGASRFVQGTVTAITDTSVTYRDAEGNSTDVEFDFVVVASGSRARFPGKLPAAGDTKAGGVALFKHSQEVIAKAKNIVIVGGGPVGVELAGEIADWHTVDSSKADTKKVTLVHSGETLLSGNGLGPRIQARVREVLEGKGVRVLLDQRLVRTSAFDSAAGASESAGTDASAGAGAAAAAAASKVGAAGAGPVAAAADEDGKTDSTPEPDSGMDESVTTYTTTKGDTIEADLTIWAVGTVVPKDHYSSWLGDGGLDEAGRIKVDEYLRIEGKTNAFALGDCANVPEAKLMANATEQSKYLVDHIVAVMNGKSPAKKYELHPPMMFPSIGYSAGVGQLPGGATMPEFIVKKVKSSNLFTSKVFGNMSDAKAPSLPAGKKLDA